MSEGKGLRRNTDQALLAGVCAGIADYFGYDRWAVRLVTLILLWAVTLPTAMIYLLAAILLPGGDRMRFIGCRREARRPRADTPTESRLDALEREWRRREAAWDEALRRYDS